MMSERKASRALPPALRMTWASPREIPKAAAGSMRASMQVTVVQEMNNGISGCRFRKWGGLLRYHSSDETDLPTAYFLAGGSARLP